MSDHAGAYRNAGSSVPNFGSWWGRCKFKILFVLLVGVVRGKRKRIYTPNACFSPRAVPLDGPCTCPSGQGQDTPSRAHCRCRRVVTKTWDYATSFQTTLGSGNRVYLEAFLVHRETGI